ncbi:MAG: DUF2793 domain-containing protein [Hyphomicrobium sp.]|jgi:hypothetical protein|uniref:DUF2793 domain-containing protein n=1 Tax=Hyphomicrobium sp. TaxID=82 RepID=UPI0025BC6C9D|nr:DUF2793 domain-containing protein [Hyphomicrobium sp.]MBX9864025.1 DUF2793 domain-containing protein [Hyphomicrobium sp.]
MDETTHLKLPYILAAQSQKHVTHNEALRALDALVQLSVLDKDLAAPPGSPAAGARYIVGAAPTGAWSGHAAHIAAYQDSAWAFYVPLEGWLAWVGDENVLYAFDGAAWAPAHGVNPVAMVGVNATADATNRLSVASAASLFNHDGAGHQLKLNKASAGQTGSVLFQTGFSGRAEFGLAGDDDFQVKVSADGSTWKQAIVTDRTTGIVTFPFTPRREVLSANRSYYVRTDGNDANTGLANTSGAAFLTLQKALDVAAALDSSIYNITINVAAGTYATAQTMKPCAGGGLIAVSGAGATTIIDPPAGVNHCFQAIAGGRFSLANMKLQKTSATTGHGILAQNGSYVQFSAIEFGALPGNGRHLYASQSATIACNGNYTISGNALQHFAAATGGFVFMNLTATLSGTPVFTRFADAAMCGVIQVNGATFTGSATGVRYLADAGGVIYTAGGGASFVPGSSAGSVSNGGQYV